MSRRTFRSEGFYRAVAGKDAEELERAMGEWAGGLTPDRVSRRLRRYGPNEFARREKRGPLKSLLHVCLNPVVPLLLAIGVILLVTGDRIGSAMVVSVTGFSVLVSFTQEMRSRKAIDGLTKMVSVTATVLRRFPVEDDEMRFRSVRMEIDVRDIVPGDIVFLSAGDIVPGDLRLLSARDLFINQSSLTGESIPVEKHARAEEKNRSASLASLCNICFLGGHVVSGRATGVVLRTGRTSYFGSVALSLSARRPPTRFERDITSFAWLIMRLTMVVAPFVFLINGLLKHDWLAAFLFTTTVVVGLTPEMLPMILAVNLARGAMVMARKKVIVKEPHAIQSFGSIDILCTDKTGTLTQDRVVLEHYLDLQGQESRKVLEYAFLNSLYQTGLKNLLDVAVLQHVDGDRSRYLRSAYRKVDEIPFDFQRRRMSVVVRDTSPAESGNEQNILIAKGAPEGILAECSFVEDGGVVSALTAERAQKLRGMIDELNGSGLRVIAVAYKLLGGRESYTVSDEARLVLLGLVSFLDPPKESVVEAISLLHRRGVCVKVLTGDNEIVTSRLTHHVGLGNRTLIGSQLDSMNDRDLLDCIDNVDIFARLDPLQKERLVTAFRRKGHVVAFMGDGINDAPALRAADVSISVDNAADIAKQSADIILLEKDLLVLEEGVVEGRKVFSNTLKYVHMGSSGNFGNILSVTLASVLLPFLPILPLQILLQNMLYDFSQATIPFDAVDREYIDRPQKWSMADTRRFMFVMGPTSSVFDLLTFAFLWFVLGAKHQPELFQTGWFIESLLSQLLIVHIVRTRRKPFIESTASWPLILSTFSVALIGVALPFSPLGALLGFVHMPPVYFAGLFAILLLYATTAHVVKAWLSCRAGS